MNGLEESLHEQINILIQTRQQLKKYAPSVLVGEASTSKANGKVSGCEKRKKDETSSTAASTSSAPITPLGGGKGKRKRVRHSRFRIIFAFIAERRAIGRGSVLSSSPMKMVMRSRKVETRSIGRRGFNLQGEKQEGRTLEEEEVKGKGCRNHFQSQGSPYCPNGKKQREMEGWSCGAHICNNLLVLERNRRLTVKLLNMAPSKMVPQTLYEIWHGKPASYKYLRVWGSPAYVKRSTRESQPLESAVKTILKYLRRTKDMSLIYDDGELILESYNDASLQSDDDDAKSQSDFVFKLNSGVVAWKSSKEATTADSTTKAEYIAA
ncbi:UNVERIFIED_CONTAM: hypothetical protein Scaly_2921200 [Sesamum calycinum]|uniref:Uncharacterized protein n=1 Tax=Sesamum calycinum TaxID=2727403 RepID=A0AAW2L171_9LAMI